MAYNAYDRNSNIANIFCMGVWFMFIIGGGVGTARAATCDAGYTMDETDGLCKITCSPGYYVKSPGDKCIAINNNYSIAYVDSEHTVIYGETSGDNVKSCPNTIKYSDMFIAFNAWNPPADLHTSIEGCRILLYGPDDGFGQYKLSCEYNPATGDYDKSCGESYSDTRTCIAGYKYLGSNRTDTCKAMSQGYCKISCGDSVYGCMNHRCTVVGYGRYSPSDELGWYNCPNGTYTTTETAAAASDCTPCTNAPANAHYTAANTTDGTPNCEWECDAGFGHTSDDRCLPLCRIGATAMNGINIYAEKHTKYAMAVPRGGGVCWINATRDNGGKLVPVN